MELLNEVRRQIQAFPGSGSSIVLAQAMAAACHDGYGVNLLRASSVLDSQSKQWLRRLADITSEPDYDNEAQQHALEWLLDGGFRDKLMRIA